MPHSIRYGQFLDASDPDQGASDVLVFATTPALMRTGPGSFLLYYLPKDDSSYAGTRDLLCISSSPDAWTLQLRQVGADTFVAIDLGGSDIVTSSPITFSAKQRLTITCNAVAGTIEIAGATTGNGVYMGTPWSLAAATMTLGGLPNGNAMCRGYLSLPYPA